MGPQNNMDVFSTIDRLVQQNPNIIDTPFKQQLYEAVKNRDSARGQELTQNFCSSMGVDPQTAFNAAGQYMNHMVQNRPQGVPRR